MSRTTRAIEHRRCKRNNIEKNKHDVTAIRLDNILKLFNLRRMTNSKELHSINKDIDSFESRIR